MENKFIRIVQPFSIISLICLLASSEVLLYFALSRVKESLTFYTVCFLIITLAVLISVIISIIKTLKSGIRFDKEKLEFTSLDDNNVYYYSDIKKAEAYKDSRASLKKNAIERYTNIIIYLKDDSVATVEIGVTSKGTAKKIEKEIQKRIDI